MTSKLRAITEAKPTQNVVETLERFLQMAKSGDLICVGICGLGRDDFIYREASFSSHSSSRRDMVAASAALQDAIMKDWLQGR
jgi:hypothetical protein